LQGGEKKVKKSAGETVSLKGVKEDDVGDEYLKPFFGNSLGQKSGEKGEHCSEVSGIPGKTGHRAAAAKRGGKDLELLQFELRGTVDTPEFDTPT